MHPRVSLSELCSWNWTLDEDLAFYEQAGITTIGASLAKLETAGWKQGAYRIRDAGLRVANLIGVGPFQLADRSLRPTFGSGLAAKQWWKDGGYTWLVSLVDLEEARAIVVPPSTRRVLASDAGLDEKTRPIAPLLCPADARTCGAAI